jgi:hypothetical protein
MTEYQLAAMSRAGEHGEPIFRAPSVGCSGEAERELDLYDALASHTGEAEPRVTPAMVEHQQQVAADAESIGKNLDAIRGQLAATPEAPSDDEQLVATLIHCSREVSPTAMTGYDLASVLSRAAERIQSIAALSHPAPVAAPAKHCEWTNCVHRVGDVCCNDKEQK